MKANELMIGDWVYSNIFKKPRILQPSDIRKILDSPEEVFDDDKNFKYIHPLPLTPEILKANGWKGTALYWSKHKVPFEISILICRTTPFINGHGSVCYYIKYVHKLQHALRLCGLNELADNFKVE